VISVALRHSHSGVADKLRILNKSDLVIPAIVRSELEFGALKGGSAARLQNLREFLGAFATLPFDDSCITVYASARHELEQSGQRIGALDLLIASIALANDLTLVTNNTAEFARVPGLRIEDWQSN